MITDSIELLERGTTYKDILYEDRFIKITNSHIFLKKYYITFQSKKIALTDIESVCTDHEYGLNPFGYKSWGMGYSMIYWAYNGNYYSKNLFILKEKGSILSCGFAVENTTEFYNVLQSKGILMHKKEK